MNALLNNRSGFANTANGYSAMDSEYHWHGQRAERSSALFHNTTGAHYTGIGINALLS